ncbi:MAG: isocitrate/isopropylmalate family dehydrogenase [Polyangiales bacterium]
MKITVAKGDGIGPEVMDAVLGIFDAANVPLEYDVVEMGEQVALAGEGTGISKAARESVESTGILFKGPMATPKGGGHKSVNVTARKMWGTFANKRVYRLLPGVPTPLRISELNLTMVRENIEDTYGGVEHMQTHDVAQCRRFITRPGSEQVHRYTFEMAKRKGSRRVTCGHKANIMKLTDGLFLDVFYEVAKDYPEIQADDVIIDAMAMKLVHNPGEFDVIVMPNLQGDILTDLAAGLVGGLAYAPSANLGDGIGIFEAVHGTAPDIAGQNLANPSALLLSGTMLLRHLGLGEHANVIEDALHRTLVRMHAQDDPAPAFQTSAFVDTMKATLGVLSLPSGKTATPTGFLPRPEPVMRVSDAPTETRLRGVDIFVESGLSPRAVAEQLEPLGTLENGMKLVMISNRGTQVWPTGSAFTDCINHYRVRFEGDNVKQSQIAALLGTSGERFPLCGAEWLREIDGKRGYSLAQGQTP